MPFCSPLPGTSVWVCEPQAVSTDLRYFGFFTSEMSKILMPSQLSLSVAGWDSDSHESSLREESVERYSRSPETLMSFWLPGQLTWTSVFGLSGLRTSMIEKPS